MFMNDFHVAQHAAKFYRDESMTSDALADSAAYEALLNTVDAARTGLASGEHDYDIVEDNAF